MVLSFEFLVSINQASAAARFGTLCQKEFQNGWRDTLDEAWNRCGWFVDELNDTDTQVFYWNLHGKKSLIETPNDQALAETVNLLYMNTHGGAWSDTATYTMWDQNQRAFTKDMWLGNESFGLSMLSTYSCETLKDDGKLPTRWVNTMSGGLRYVSGSFDTVYDGVTTNEQGEDYADELQSSNTFKYAWKDSVSDAYSDEDAAVMATGANESDCFSRLKNMKWQNYPSFGRLTGSSIGWFCRTFWSL